MIVVTVIGVLLIVFGLVNIIKGNIPFIKKYNGVKRITVHSRLEGGAAICAGLLFFIQSFWPMGWGTIIGVIFVIFILTIVLEIAFKAI